MTLRLPLPGNTGLPMSEVSWAAPEPEPGTGIPLGTLGRSCPPAGLGAGAEQRL